MDVLVQPNIDNRQQIAEQLLRQQNISPNQHWLAHIIASWLKGESVLPDYLGLKPSQFSQLNQTLYAHIELPGSAPSGINLDNARSLEKEDLIALLQSFSVHKNQESEWIITIIVTACLGLDHLWQDLGLWQRSELTELLIYNFPELAQSNTQDMKWKKFLYKKLCDAEDINLCRAPSCEVCTDYANCYGSEEEALHNQFLFK